MPASATSCARRGRRRRGRPRSSGVRVVCLRIGLVLGTEGGFITRMLTPFEFGLGGPLGTGRRWMSWIERDDLIRLIAYVMATPDLTGPVNATAPIPVTNAKIHRRARPSSAPARGVSYPRRVVAPDRRRLCRRTPARWPACAAQQGAEPRFCLSARNAAQRVRGDPVR